MKENLEFVRNNMRCYRNKAGLSQEATANKLGISRVMYCNYEVDPSLVKIKTFYLLADIYHCKLSDFFEQNIVTLSNDKKEKGE